MNNIKIKRIMAYLIDILIITFLVTLLSQIKFLNPNEEKYNETVSSYNTYIEEKTSGEIENISDIINEEYIRYSHDLSYYSVSYLIILFVVVILYFTLFPFFYHGQTIGKKLMKIKLATDAKKISIWRYLLRGMLVPIWTSIILYNGVSYLLNIIIIFTLDSFPFLYANLITTYLITIYLYVDIVFMLVRKDSKSLHDLICNTTVVDIAS